MARRASLGVAVLGAALGLLLAVGVIAAASRDASSEGAPPAPGALLPEADGRLTAVAMHWTPEMDAATADTYADFLRALPADVAVSLVIGRDPDPAVRARLEERLRAIDPSGGLARRMARVEVRGPSPPGRRTARSSPRRARRVSRRGSSPRSSRGASGRSATTTGARSRRWPPRAVAATPRRSRRSTSTPGTSWWTPAAT